MCVFVMCVYTINDLPTGDYTSLGTIHLHGWWGVTVGNFVNLEPGVGEKKAVLGYRNVE